MKNVRAAFPLFFLLVLINGCGGGGGGKGEASGPSISFSPSVAQATFENGEPAIIDLHATSSQPITGTVYAKVVVDGNYFHSADVAILSQSSAKLRLQTKAVLPVGEHKGTISVSVCSDQSCTRQIGKSPYSVPFVLNVRPGFAVFSDTASWTTVSGVTPESKSLKIGLPSEYSTSQVRVVTDQKWLKFAFENESLNLQPFSMPPGYYRGDMYLQLPGRERRVKLEYHVQPAAGGTQTLEVSKKELAVSYAQGGRFEEEIAVTPASWTNEYETKVHYYEYAEHPWLEVRKSRPEQIVLSIDTEKLGKRNSAYMADVRFELPGLGWVKTLPVRVSVTDGIIVPSEIKREVTSDSVASDLDVEQKIDLANNNKSIWIAEAKSSWITIHKSEGLSGEKMKVEISRSKLAAMKNNSSETAEIALRTQPISAEGKSIYITVEKKLSEVLAASPNAQPSEGLKTVLVRGKNLNVANIEKRLTIGGNKPLNVQAQSDQEMLVTFGQMSPGEVKVKIDNSLQLSARETTLNIVGNQAVDFSVFHTDIDPHGVVFDRATRRFFMHDRDQTSVTQFTQVGSTWVKKTQILRGVLGIDLSVDRKFLYAITKGELFKMDASTLRVLDSWKTIDEIPGSTINWVAGRKIFVMNNGKILLPHNSHFDWESGLPLENRYPYSGFPIGPTYIATISENGKHAFSNSGLYEGSPFYTHMSSSDMKLERVNVNAYYGVSEVVVSDHGARVFISPYNMVYDKNGNLMGRIEVPAGNYRNLTGVFSPDEKTLYLVGINNMEPGKKVVVAYDVRNAVAGGGPLPQLGVAVPEKWAGGYCRVPGICLNGWAAISADGNTLYIANWAIMTIPLGPDMKAPSSRATNEKTVRWN